MVGATPIRGEYRARHDHHHIICLPANKQLKCWTGINAISLHISGLQKATLTGHQSTSVFRGFLCQGLCLPSLVSPKAILVTALKCVS